MYAIQVMLFLGALVPALFTFLFLAGSLIYLVSLVTEVLLAISRPRNVKAEVPQTKPVVQARVPFKVPQKPIRDRLTTQLVSQFE